jgi:DNA-binding MarR family transcriptional regulator
VFKPLNRGLTQANKKEGGSYSPRNDVHIMKSPNKNTKKACHLSLQDAAQAAFLPLLRDLVRAYHLFENYSAKHLRSLGLTPAQFDVISSLGNMPGLSLSKLAEVTLITKGTLTGIIDRLEKKNLVRREISQADRRSFIATLTPAGIAIFHHTFPIHIAYLQQRFDLLGPRDMKRAQQSLKKLHDIF